MTRKDIQFIGICVGAAAVVVIAAYLVWSPAPTQVAEYAYVASINSEVFHQPDCTWVKKISPRNLVTFKSREDAINSGRRPCKVCGP